jgi:hypothetical protein
MQNRYMETFLFEPYHEKSKTFPRRHLSPQDVNQPRQPRHKVIRQTKEPIKKKQFSISARRLVKICELRAKGVNWRGRADMASCPTASTAVIGTAEISYAIDQ